MLQMSDIFFVNFVLIMIWSTKIKSHLRHSRQLPVFLFRRRCWRILFFYFFVLQILKNITWYAERVLTEISLGSLLILVVIRTIQYNMTRTRVRAPWSTCEFQTSAALMQFQTGGGILLILLQSVGIWFWHWHFLQEGRK